MLSNASIQDEHAATNPHDKSLRQLEAESIFILREVAAEFDRPVLLYSIGKDSSSVSGHAVD